MKRTFKYKGVEITTWKTLYGAKASGFGLEVESKTIKEAVKQVKEHINMNIKVKRNIIRNCDYCGHEDAINPITGLCPSCDKRNKNFGGVF